MHGNGLFQRNDCLIKLRRLDPRHYGWNIGKRSGAWLLQKLQSYRTSKFSIGWMLGVSALPECLKGRWGLCGHIVLQKPPLSSLYESRERKDSPRDCFSRHLLARNWKTDLILFKNNKVDTCICVRWRWIVEVSLANVDHFWHWVMGIWGLMIPSSFCIC